MRRGKLLISNNSTWNFVNFRKGLVRALVDNGYEVVAVAPDDGYASQVIELGCRHEPVSLVRRSISPAADARLLAQYLRILNREKPDAHLSFTIKPNLYGSMCAHALGVPAICNVAGLGTTFLGKGPLNKTVRMMYRTALRRSHVVFFQNPDDRELFVSESLADARTSRLLPGSGIDLNAFSPDAAPRSKLGAASFLLVSRLLWSKGIREYASAAERLKHRYPEARFKLLGLPETSSGAVDRAWLDEKVQAGHIEYLGSADDVRPYIRGADCIVLPSYYPEGTPRALLEGAAMGKPLITTHLPGCRQVVDQGRNGFFCTPGDVASLETAMERVLQMSEIQRAEMGQASRRLAERTFDEQFVIKAYLEALGSLKRAT